MPMTFTGEESESELEHLDSLISAWPASGSRGRAELHAQTEGSSDSSWALLLYYGLPRVFTISSHLYTHLLRTKI